MIVINDIPGQLCNRLWAYSAFIAIARKYRLNIIIPYLGDYHNLFDNLQIYPEVRFINCGNSQRIRRNYSHP